MQRRPRKNDKQNNLLITLVVISHNSEDLIIDWLEKAKSFMRRQYTFFEIIIIDNKSSDLTTTKIRESGILSNNVRLLVLSRETDRDTAILSALDNCVGDYVIIADSIESKKFELVPVLVIEALEGFDVVVARRKNKEKTNFARRIMTLVLSKILKKALGFIPDFRHQGVTLFSRHAVNSLIKIRNKKRIFMFLDMYIGLKRSVIYYSNFKEVNNLTWIRELRLVFDILTSYSNFPLRLVTLIGTLASILSLLFLFYVIIVSILKQRIIEGWITTSIVNGTLFLLMFIILTVMSEYMSRILDETRDQPIYFMSEEMPILSRKKTKRILNVVK